MRDEFFNTIVVQTHLLNLANQLFTLFFIGFFRAQIDLFTGHNRFEPLGLNLMQLFVLVLDLLEGGQHLRLQLFL